MIISLTKEEQEKFSAWLRQGIEALERLVPQLESNKKKHVFAITSMKTEIFAFSILASKLENMKMDIVAQSWEDM